jgi:hypothetical protein
MDRVGKRFVGVPSGPARQAQPLETEIIVDVILLFNRKRHSCR